MDGIGLLAGLAVLWTAFLVGVAVVKLGVLGSSPAAAGTLALVAVFLAAVGVAAARSRPRLSTVYWR